MHTNMNIIRMRTHLSGIRTHMCSFKCRCAGAQTYLIHALVYVYGRHTHLIPSTRIMHHTYSLNKCMRRSHSQQTPCIHTYIMHTHIYHTSCILDSIDQMHSFLFCQTFSYFRHTKVHCTLPQIPGHHDPEEVVN